MTTWKELLKQEMKYYNDDMKNIVSVSPKNLNLDKNSESEDENPFTIWTNDRVYFPMIYNDFGLIESVSRNPNDENTLFLIG